ncbi:Flp pilus assembly protein CpaB [Nocardioides jishulii]|uniref:Flp pilus assembly protein CpaB n=1 Tax=Nocardioides jishulii TaxID=2575440 RepID=A0A4U2YKG3_9ACTN|nr:Flp pilus assembly protein CpaB [Nocardioides jishulii]QCX27144.1 Flp pilus assembly protein CpaB [Nocardioides jishulii]TKI61628.1 Flp pilus assembly protein CpaB [Nocardioides jishulii]
MDRRKLLLVVAVVVAAIGAAFVFVYVQGADKRAASQYETVEVLTAVQPILTGESISEAAEAGKLQRSRIPRNVLLPTAVSTVDSLKGLAANTNIYAGEQIVPEKFGGVAEASRLPIPKGTVAVSVELSDTARVAGFVEAGSEVAVWVTADAIFEDPNVDPIPFTRLLLPKVTVLAAGSTTLVAQTSTEADGTATTEQLPRTLLTLAVDQDQAERIKYAAANGELSFGLLSEDSKVQRSNGVTAKNLFN